MEEERVVENIDDIDKMDEIRSHTSDNGSMSVNIAHTELDEREQVENNADGSDVNSSDADGSDDGSDASSEYTEVDLTQNEMYQVLSTFLESSEGYNLCDIILALKNSIDENNQLLRYALTRNVTDEN